MKSSKKTSRPGREYLSSFERGLSVIKCFSRESPEMTISEISQVTNLNPAVTRRCLYTLMHLGYIGKKGKLFLLRPQILSLGSAFLESMNVEEAFRPSLQNLNDITGDSSSLTVLTENDIIFLIYVSTHSTIHHYVGVGKRLPAYVAATGRCMLAHEPKELLENYLMNLKIRKYTDKTVSSIARLRRILNNIRRHGYACVQGEIDPLVVSLAVPIFSPEGTVVASINCSTSIKRADEQIMISSRLPHLQAAAKKIEMELRRYPLLVHSISSKTTLLPQQNTAGE